MTKAKSLKLVVLVSGRGSNLQAIIDASEKKTIQSQIIHVISNKEGVLSLERCQKHGIPYSVIPSKGKERDVFFDEVLNKVKSLNPDLIVLAGFMKILPEKFVKAFENQIINIHPSLLPKFTGLNAQKQALEAGETKTGCTVHFVDEGCDTGPVILQKEIEIDPKDTEETLSARLLPVEHECFVEAILKLENQELF